MNSWKTVYTVNINNTVESVWNQKNNALAQANHLIELFDLEPRIESGEVPIECLAEDDVIRNND